MKEELIGNYIKLQENLIGALEYLADKAMRQSGIESLEAAIILKLSLQTSISEKDLKIKLSDKEKDKVKK